jgi:hypothetical protein
MVDVVITAADVKMGSNADVRHGVAGEEIAAGDAVFLDTTDSKIKLSDNDAAGKKTVSGIALNGAAVDQPIAYQRGGDLNIGGTLEPGTSYYLSDTAGGIIPEGDLGAGMDSVVIGVAKSASVLSLNIKATGVTIAGA